MKYYIGNKEVNNDNYKELLLDYNNDNNEILYVNKEYDYIYILLPENLNIVSIIDKLIGLYWSDNSIDIVKETNIPGYTLYKKIRKMGKDSQIIVKFKINN